MDRRVNGIVFSRRADEALSMAAAAKAEAATAITEIRNHATFCTEREAKRDKEHLQNITAINTLSMAVANLRGWVVALLLSVAATIIIGLIVALTWMIIHFVIDPPTRGSFAGPVEWWMS